jgi:hypothetical protein
MLRHFFSVSLLLFSSFNPKLDNLSFHFSVDFENVKKQNVAVAKSAFLPRLSLEIRKYLQHP